MKEAEDIIKRKSVSARIRNEPRSFPFIQIYLLSLILNDFNSKSDIYIYIYTYRSNFHWESNVAFLRRCVLNKLQRSDSEPTLKSTLRASGLKNQRINRDETLTAATVVLFGICENFLDRRFPRAHHNLVIRRITRAWE